MQQEANEHGVKIVRLGDFLNYVGYSPNRRLFGRYESAVSR